MEMRDSKHRIKRFLALLHAVAVFSGFFMLNGLFITGPVWAQEKNQAGSTQIVDKDISELQQQVRDIITKYNQGDRRDNLTIRLGIGMHNRITDPSPAVYLEEARITFASGGISEMTFYYTQTDVKSLVDRSRMISNPKFATDDLSELETRYESSQSKIMSFTLKDIKTPESRNHVMMMYRDYLKQLIRVTEYSLHRLSTTETRDIDSILRLGNSR